MDYNEAYMLSKEAVDVTVFKNKSVLDAYNELLDTSYCDDVQEPVFDMENTVRDWFCDNECPDGVEPLDFAVSLIEDDVEHAIGVILETAEEAGII